MEIVCITDVDDLVQTNHNLDHRKVMEEIKQASIRMVNPAKLFTFSVGNIFFGCFLIYLK